MRSLRALCILVVGWIAFSACGCIDDLQGSYCLPDATCREHYFCDRSWDAGGAAPGRCRLGEAPTVQDSGEPDASVNDAGNSDGGTFDGGNNDGGAQDSGTRDAGPDPRLCDGGVITYGVGMFFPDFIVADGDHVYWSLRTSDQQGQVSPNVDGGGIFSADICGLQPPQKIVKDRANVVAIVPAGNELFFGVAGDSTVARTEKDGGVYLELQSHFDGGNAVTFDLAVANGYVYWLTRNTNPQQIRRAPVSATSGGFTVFLADAGQNPNGAAGGLALDSDELYYGSTDGIRAIPLDGGTIRCVIDSGGGAVKRISVGGDWVTWFTAGSSNLGFALKTTSDCSSTAPHFASTLPFDKPQSLAVYGDAVYYAAYTTGTGAGTIKRFDLDGGLTTNPVLSNVYLPVRVWTDGVRLYWTEGDNSFLDGGAFSMPLPPP